MGEVGDCARKHGIAIVGMPNPARSSDAFMWQITCHVACCHGRSEYYTTLSAKLGLGEDIYGPVAIARINLAMAIEAEKAGKK